MFCIYHGNCPDGFGAAWAFHQKYPDTDFFAGVYGKPHPDVTGQDVVMVDFTYKRNVLIEMAKTAKSILIIDHHASAQRDLVDLPENVSAIFDMRRSGSVLTWEHYFPEKPVPNVLRYIEDRDLWKFTLPNSKEISSFILSFPYEFGIWTDMVDNFNETKAAAEGNAIRRITLKNILELIDVAAYRIIIDGYDVPVLNAPYMYASDAGNIMSVNEPFSATYYDTEHLRHFSLRSQETGLDVSKIAQKFGGGGHEHAAGFEMNLELYDKDIHR